MGGEHRYPHGRVPKSKPIPSQKRKTQAVLVDLNVPGLTLDRIYPPRITMDKLTKAQKDEFATAYAILALYDGGVSTTRLRFPSFLRHYRLMALAARSRSDLLNCFIDVPTWIDLTVILCYFIG